MRASDTPLSDAAASVPARFRLHGPMRAYDKRTTPIRGDLADVKLAGELFAPHYAVPQMHRCIRPAAIMRAHPSADARAVSELIYGERFALLDVSNGYAWGYSAHDDYLGHVALDALDALDTLGDTGAQPTHIVCGGAALLFAAPDIKSAVTLRLPLGARLACREIEESGAAADFLASDAGYVHRRHVAQVGAVDGDSADIARKFLGTPYLWGGRSGDGIDCSGLVQTVLAVQGIAAPRDTDQQMAALGTAIADGAPLQRGDLVFFPGHVGFMTDADTIIHANAHWMQVAEEPLADVIARFPEDTERAVLARKRPG